MHLNKKIIFGVVFFAAFGVSFLAIHTPSAHAYSWCSNNGVVKYQLTGGCPSGSTDITTDYDSNPSKYENIPNEEKAKALAEYNKGLVSNDNMCNLSGTNGLAICISNLVYYIMVGVFSSIAYICAFFFDLAVQLSLNSTTYALAFLTTSWTIIRDLSNMAFIFILIYIAVEVMLTADNSQTLKTLAAVIVVALLVNFSFFFTRVAIDAGNLLALQFYNAIEGRPIGANPAGVNSAISGGATNNPSSTSAANFMSGFTALASGGGPLTPGNTKDLTASIMDGIQVQNIVNTESFKRYADPKQTPNSSSMYILITLSTIYIAVGIAFGVLAGAFLFAGAKFVMRIVGLWFVIILSPLALVAATLPNAGAKALFRKWLNHLVNFSFYPAAFLFMFFVLSRFMKELNIDPKTGLPSNFLGGVFASSPAGFSDGTFGFITILSAIANVGVRLGFVIAMMYLALSAADILARSRGDMTSGWAKSFAGWAGGGIAGGVIGAFGRQTAGRIGRWTGSEALANRTYDPRNIPLFGRALTGFEPSTRKPYSNYGALPIDYGTGAKNGLGLTKDQIKAKDKADRLKKKREERAENRQIEAEEGGGQARPNPATAPPNPAPPVTPPPVPPAPPTTPPQNTGPGAGGNMPTGRNRYARMPGTTTAANQNQQPPAQGGTAGQAPAVHISQADIAGSAAAQRALQNIEKEAAARNASAARNLYLQNQGENLMSGKPSAGYEDRVASLQRQGEDIKELVREQSDQLRKTAAQVAVVAALSKEPSMSRSSGSRVEIQRVAAPAHSEISEETMQKMKKMMRTVIRKEIPNIVESVAENRPPEPPRTPAGGAMRPPSPAANENNPPDAMAA